MAGSNDIGRIFAKLAPLVPRRYASGVMQRQAAGWQVMTAESVEPPTHVPPHEAACTPEWIVFETRLPKCDSIATRRHPSTDREVCQPPPGGVGTFEVATR